VEGIDHLRQVFLSSRDALGVSLRGKHVMVNPAYLALFGYDQEEELFGTDILTLIAPDARAAVAERVALRAGGKGAAEVYESRGLRRDGTQFDLQVHVSSYGDERGIYTLVTLRDVTERNRTARELAESEQKFRLLTEQSLMGVSIYQDGYLLFVNQVLCEMLEVTREELVGVSLDVLWNFVHPDDANVLAPIANATSTDQQLRFRARTKSGRTKWMELHSKEIMWNGRPAVLISQLDIDARHAAEAERAALEEALRQSQKMEAVGRLAGGIAHDFNNLLTIILGNLHFVKAGVTPGSMAEEALEESVAASARAAQLTAQLLSFSRKQVIAPQPVDPNDVLKNTQSLLRRSIGADIHLTVTPQSGLPLIKADAAQLEQVLVNLVLNARDAVSSGGHISVSTALDGTNVRLTVEDDGCGMSEEVQSRIFEPFFTTKGVGEGTGLGLAMVFGAVAQNEGKISVKSELGKGARFDLLFPALAATAVTSKDPVALAPSGGHETVLVVEDEPALRTLAVRVLTGLGYQVLACEGGPAALELASDTSIHIDLLFTDMIMPGMSGRDLATRLVAERPALKVLFTSGFTREVLQADDAGDVGFLRKPYVPGELARRIRAALDR